jgi:hypothetical protein
MGDKTRPSGGISDLDREAPRPKASGSFMIFLARVEHVILQLDGHRSLLADALRTEARLMATEFSRWPDRLPTDVVERLAKTADAYQRVTGLEDQLRDYLAGGR